MSERGTSNPALDIATHSNHIEARLDDDDDDDNPSGCFNNLTSPDSEYDEDLAFPDSVTILSIGGGNPILVERKDDDAESLAPETDIPFITVYKLPVKFKSLQRKIFIPGQEIHVKIIDNERSTTTHLLNPNLYTIQLTHGQFTWTIKRRYKHISALHQHLRVYRASLHIPFPTRSHRERRASFRDSFANRGETDNTGDRAGKKKRRRGALPRFPNRPESLVPVEVLPERINQLEEYLYNLLTIRLYKNHHETVNFLEVSQLSFITGLGEKGKEGPIMKRTRSTRPGQAGCNFCGWVQYGCCIRCNHFCSDVICGQWRTRWFFVKETFFGHLNPKDGSIRNIVLFDQGFDVSTGIYSTGMRNGLHIITNNRELILKSWTRRKAKEWLNYFKAVAINQARDFTLPNAHMSYAPVRMSIQAYWFVDGAPYMSAVADAMEAATEEIYIADWWLSPEIYMKRPAIAGDYWRLDHILKRKATQGVRIFILVYKELEMALGINSYYSKQRLVELHENIKVFRHPDHTRVGVFLWAHHEKIVCVDQTYAFLGGVDLCYGRWDDYRHRLTDTGSISTTSSIATNKTTENGNPKFELPTSTPLPKVPRVTINTPDQSNLPRLEAGDKLIMNFAQNDTIQRDDELDENTKQNTPEMERRNMLGKLKGMGGVIMSRIVSHEDPPKDKTAKSPAIQFDKNLVFSPDELRNGARGDFVDPMPYQTELYDNLDGQAKLWIGKDYTNFIMKDFSKLELPLADHLDRNTQPRMPWHDVSCVVVGAAARDVARHFIQRWNATKMEKSRDNPSFPYLLPKSYESIRVLEKVVPVPLKRVTCQVLRSVSSWSCGFIEQDTVEQSIHDAYIQTITKAQHYIYIENQFFISLEFGTQTVRNQVADHLYRRIIRAFKEKKVFRVYVVMPLLPGFEGDVGGASGNALRAITHWNYASMCRGKSSIIARLKAAGVDDPRQYISFHSLRKHDILNGAPVTELIYVHSKLLIADDKVVICGSANINDRSMIGKRDSEIAVIINDEEYEEGKMNCEVFPSGIFAGQLRRFLFKEHLGLIEPNPDREYPIDIRDPTCDAFWNGTWIRTSRRNTQIFDDVFKCIPCDAVKTFSVLRKYNDGTPLCKSDINKAFQELKRIQGNLVDMPLEFLSQEVLTPSINTKEGLIPTSVWT